MKFVQAGEGQIFDSITRIGDVIGGRAVSAGATETEVMVPLGMVVTEAVGTIVAVEVPVKSREPGTVTAFDVGVSAPVLIYSVGGP